MNSLRVLYESCPQIKNVEQHVDITVGFLLRIFDEKRTGVLQLHEAKLVLLFLSSGVDSGKIFNEASRLLQKSGDLQKVAVKKLFKV